MSALNVQYYHADHLGSAQLMTSAGGWPVSSSTFLPYGQEVNPTATTNHYKFTGKERDSESGFDYFGARYYSNRMGRWLTPDWSDSPASVPYADFGDPQSLNLYGYVGNRPITIVDVDGHWPSVADAIARITSDPATVDRVLKGVVAATAAAEATAAAGGAVVSSAILAPIAAAVAVGGTIESYSRRLKADADFIEQAAGADNDVKERNTAAEPKTDGAGARKGGGRNDRQERLDQIAEDPKVSSANRGWLKQERNQIDRGKRTNSRVPPGTQLSHSRGREAAKGYSHTESPSNLQNIQNHKTQHRHDAKGKKNKERK